MIDTLKEKALLQTQKLKEELSKQGWKTYEVKLKQYNYEFDVANSSSKFKILIYFGKKGIKKVVQGNTDLPEYYKIKEIVSGSPELFQAKEIDEPNEYIGTDESGKGDIFGPLCVAAVYVNEETKEKLLRIGVEDSKNLTSNKIFLIADKIKKIVDGKFVVLELKPEKYNEIYNRFGNLNKLLAWAHSEAIEKLLNKVECETVIIDKFANRKLDIEENFKFGKVQFLKYSKGERFTGVAAASVLARAKFEEWFELNKIDGKTLPKGASQEAETFLKQLLMNYDKKKLSNFAKLHFKSFNKFK